MPESDVIPKYSALKNAFNQFGYFRTSKEGFFEKIGSLLDRTIYIFLYVVATLVFSISCAFVSSNNHWWLGIGIGSLFLILAAIGNHFDMERSKEENSEIKKKLEIEKIKVRKAGEESERTGIKLQETNLKLIETHEQLVTSILKSIFKNLELDTYTRVSIYFEECGQFLILGRYSQNPKFKEIHTRVFPINKGALSKAWEHGQYHDDECCSYDDDKSGYEHYQKQKFDYDQEQTESLTMKSCEYVGVALTHIDEHIGVILFESENKEFVSKQRDGILEQVANYHTQLSDRIVSGKLIHSEKQSTKDVDEEFMLTMLIQPEGRL